MIKYFIFTLSYISYLCLRRYPSVSLVYVTAIWTIAFGLKSENYGVDIIYYFKIFSDPYLYQIDEPALKVLNAGISSISEQYIFFSLVYALIVNGLLGLLMYSIDKKNAALYFIFFTTTFVFYQINLNIFRQGVSVILLLLGLQVFSRNKLISLGVVLLSILFHKAAIFGLLLFSGYFLRINKAMILVAVILMIFPVGGLVEQITNAAIGVFGIFERTLSAYTDMANSGLIKESSMNHRNLPLLLSASLLLFCDKDKLEKNNVLLIAFFIPIVASSFFATNVLIYDRIIIYSQILQPFVLYLALNAKYSKVGAIVYIMIIILQLLFTVSFWGPRNDMGDFVFYPFV
ncbi:EpsG family protein [Shewanella submarina]|uniref:EpsG family protein n=1 Tax=Shewanella submarina TaxID=2016376 RepID=A0ABV7GD76_9GAMM|nr:EpsG family protein [Shewanella submarina]MCL1037489.1 EpsG family protein [Shewanella submarina]